MFRIKVKFRKHCLDKLFSLLFVLVTGTGVIVFIASPVAVLFSPACNFCLYSLSKHGWTKHRQGAQKGHDMDSLPGF